MLQLRTADRMRPSSRLPTRTSVPHRERLGSQSLFVPRDPELAVVLLAIGDLAAFAIAFGAVALLYTSLTGAALPAQFPNYVVISVLSFLVVHMAAKSYGTEKVSRISRVSWAGFVAAPAAWTSIGLVFAYAIQAIILRDGAAAGQPTLFGLSLELWAILFAAPAFALERMIGYHLLSRWTAAGHLATNVVIFGAGQLGQRLVKTLRENYTDCVGICGIFDDRLDRVPSHIRGIPVEGDIDDLVEIVRRTPEIDKVLIALPMSAEQRIFDLMSRLRSLAVGVALVPDFVGLEFDKQVMRGNHPPILNVTRKPQSQFDWLVKRGFDIAVSSALLVLLSPLLALTALAIRLDSEGPIFFRQPRLGLNNQVFNVLKFRTMYVDRLDLAAREQTKRDDPRVTRVGQWLRRLSIDELPQLWNVLSGDMSLVGPRPHALGMQVKNRLCDEIVREYAVRHRMRPGITGWAQVRGLRGAIEEPALLEARVEHDIYYIDNWSFFFDIRILVMTAVELVRPRNAF